MREARIHDAARPGRDVQRTTRIVQPCGRCGIVLSEFDEERPPMAVGPDPMRRTPSECMFVWWGEGDAVQSDPGYPQGGRTMMYGGRLPEDAMRVPLCSPEEADAAGVEVFRTRTDAPVTLQ